MFGPLLEVEKSKKVHAVVAPSTFRSQNVQNTPSSDHFWKLRCRKSVRCCGAKHVCNWFGALWIVEMSKKCTPFVAQSIFRSENVQSTPCSDHFWKLKCRKSARCCGAKHISKSKMYKTHQIRTLLEVEMSKKCTLFVARSTFCNWFGTLWIVEMSKKCTPLWREAHFEVKMYKTHQVWTTFGS